MHVKSLPRRNGDTRSVRPNSGCQAYAIAAKRKPYVECRLLSLVRGTHKQLNRMAGVSPSAKTFTSKQGQYLAFIHLYTRLHRRPPAETDMQEYFRVSPPSIHQMVLTLERAGLIRRQPRTPRSIELLVDPKHLPELI